MHTRRSFIARSLAAAASAAAAPLLGAARPTLASSMREATATDLHKVSVMAYSFHGLLNRGMMDIFGLLETYRYRYNLQAADLWNGFLPTLETDFLAKVKEALDERELVVPNLACDNCTVWVDDAEAREKMYRNALAHLEAGKVLGARFVRIDAGGAFRDREWTTEQFDHIVMRYQEYAQYAYDNGFKAGAESHWGPEAWWPSMKKLCEAVDHPGFAICCHISGWAGTQEEKDLADVESVPWVVHTHIPWNIVEGPLVEKMNVLRSGGYHGYYSIEHHSAKHEYDRTAVQLAKVRSVMAAWRAGEDGGLL